LIGAARAFAVDLPAGYRRVDPQRYFGRDPASFSERVTPDGTIRKAVWLGERAVELRISFAGDAAHCEIVAGFDPAMPTLPPLALPHRGSWESTATRRLRDAVSRRCDFGRALAAPPELRIPLAADPFEALVWAIVGQQINLRFASRLRNILGAIAGTPTGSGLTAQPRAGTLALVSPAELRARQFSQTKPSTSSGRRGRSPTDFRSVRFRSSEGSVSGRPATWNCAALGSWTACRSAIRACGRRSRRLWGAAGIA